MELPVYYSSELDCYGLTYYMSAFTMRLSGKSTETDEAFLQAQWLQNYKRTGARNDKAKLLINAFAEKMNIDCIVAAVASKPELNQLQKDFGSDYMQRIVEVQKAKYNEGGKKNGFRSEPFKPETCVFNIDLLKERGYKRIMILDDIAKTGETMKGMRKPFIDAGFDVVSCVVGLSYKLTPHHIPTKYYGSGYDKNVVDEIVRDKGLEFFPCETLEEVYEHFKTKTNAYELYNRKPAMTLLVEGMSFALAGDKSGGGGREPIADLDFMEKWQMGKIEGLF